MAYTKIDYIREFIKSFYFNFLKTFFFRQFVIDIVNQIFVVHNYNSSSFDSFWRFSLQV